MANETRTVELNLDIEGALRQLRELSDELRSFGEEASDVPVGPDEEGASRNTNSVVSTMRRGFKSIRNAAGEAFKVVDAGFDAMKGAAIGTAAAIAGVGAAVISVGSGLRDLSQGLRNVLTVEANRGFLNQARQITAATGGLITELDALTSARIASSVDIIKPRDIEMLSKYAAQLALTSSEGANANDILKEMIKNINEGTVGGMFGDLSPQARMQFDAWKEANAGMSKAQERAGTLKIIVDNALQSMQREGNVLNSTFGKIFGAVNHINNALEEMGGLFSGVGKVVGGVFAPALAGLAGFAVNPIGGIFGLGVGGTLSALLVSAFTEGAEKLGSKIWSEGQGVNDAMTNIIGAFKDGLKAIMEVIFQVFTGRGFFDTSISKKSRKTLSDMIGIPFQEVLQNVALGVKSVQAFSDDMIATLKTNIPQLKANLNLFTLSIKGFLNAIGVETKDISGAKTYGQAAGEVLTTLTSAISKFVFTLLKLAALIPGSPVSEEKVSSAMGVYLKTLSTQAVAKEFQSGGSSVIGSLQNRSYLRNPKQMGVLKELSSRFQKEGLSEENAIRKAFNQVIKESGDLGKGGLLQDFLGGPDADKIINRETKGWMDKKTSQVIPGGVLQELSKQIGADQKRRFERYGASLDGAPLPVTSGEKALELIAKNQAAEKQISVSDERLYAILNKIVNQNERMIAKKQQDRSIDEVKVMHIEYK